MTDNEEKNRRDIVPIVGGELTKPGSGLVRRGLQELSRLGPGRSIATSSEKGRVLVCDLQEGLVEWIVATLVTAGYEVRSTPSSLEALEIARAFQPHLALLGLIILPMHSVELAPELTRLLPRTKIVITSCTTKEYCAELFREKILPYEILYCPFESNVFLEKTRAWVHAAMHPNQPRIMVVSTEEAINEVIPDMLSRNGCIAIATGTKRKDGWPVYEIIEEAKTFRPDVVFLLHNLHLWPKMTGVDLAILLFENFPGTIFLVGRWADGQFTVSGEALAYARSHGCHCETVNIPFEVTDILTKIGAWNAERGPAK